MNADETGDAREADLALLIADLCGALGKKRFKNVAHRVAVFEPVNAAATIAYAGNTYRFCSLECSRMFAEAPELYVAGG